MNWRSLKFKVGLYLTVALSLAVVLFTALVVWYQRNELLDTVAGHVSQLSEVITRSTRFAMLQNQPTYVDTIIRDVAQQHGIDRIRIFSKDGRITQSTYRPRDRPDRGPQGRRLLALPRDRRSRWRRFPRASGHGLSPPPTGSACWAAWR